MIQGYAISGNLWDRYGIEIVKALKDQLKIGQRKIEGVKLLARI